MTKQILPEELQIHSLKIANIVTYLHQNGWQTVTHPNPRLLVFRGGADDAGNPIYVVLPSQNTFQDSDRLLTKAVNLLAAIEDKSPQEIINLLIQTPVSSTAGT
jgi:riboflavin biosynthesis pyrimidine reductase